jgi:hypothetical protein
MTKQGKKCVRRYMARKMWAGFHEGCLPSLAIAAAIVAIVGTIWWFQVCCPFAFSLLAVLWLGAAVWGLTLGILIEIKGEITKLYREAKDACDD